MNNPGQPRRLSVNAGDFGIVPTVNLREVGVRVTVIARGRP